MATLFPSSIDTAATLYDVVNNATSTLSGSYTAGGTTIDLASAALFPATGGIIYVGNERTAYTGKASNQLTGVTPLSNNYGSGTAVAMYVDAEHHNVLRGAIVALENRVGETGSTIAGTLTKRIADLESSSSDVATQIHAASAKTTPEDSDEFGLADNAGAWALKKSTWANLKATLWAAWGALINGGTGKTTPVDADAVVLMDSAASNATKKLTWANIKATLFASPAITTPTLTSPKETRTAPTISGGTLTLDLSTASIFDVSLNAAITTFSITNPAASGTAHGFVLTFTADGTARAVTWGASIKWPGGTAPTLTSTNGKKDVFAMFSTDGGTSWNAVTVGQSL
jgi:hypothetical protein